MALQPGTANHGHGHQNEAADDLVLVHTDSVHRHFNPYDKPALALVIKAKWPGCTSA